MLGLPATFVLQAGMPYMDHGTTARFNLLVSIRSYLSQRSRETLL